MRDAAAGGTPPRSARRQWLVGAVAGAVAGTAALSSIALPAVAADDDGWAALSDGAVVLFRHAEAPGVGDPPGFRLDECATQRNLDARGRAQARAIGDAFRDRGIAVGAVWSSRWCRARETASIAFGREPRPEPAFDSFFAGQGDREAQLRASRALLRAWNGPGVLVVTTHQVNITGLTGLWPASGEGVVLRRSTDGIAVVGRLPPPF